MMIASNVREYSVSREFLIKESSVEEIKQVYYEIDFKKAKTIEEMNDLLIEDGTTDEEIIENILDHKKGNFIVEFVDNRHDGYFKVIEIENEIMIPIIRSTDEKTKKEIYVFEEMTRCFEQELSFLDNKEDLKWKVKMN